MLADHTDGSDSHRAVPPGYPHVDAVLRAVELSRRPGASFSRSLGWPLPPHRDQFVHGLLGTDATDALLLEGDVVPPPMCSSDWKPMCRGRQPGA
jgi:hypothetical protein